MKRFLAFFLLFTILFFNIKPGYSNEDSQISFTAEKIDKSSLTGQINGKILKKYTPIRLTIQNNSPGEIYLPDSILFTDSNGKLHRVPRPSEIFEKTQTHTVRRAVIYGVGTSLFIISIIIVPAVVAASIAHSVKSNDVLEENIKKNNYKKLHLFSNDTYSAYIFIKDKNAEQIIIKGVKAESDKKIDLKALVSEESF